MTVDSSLAARLVLDDRRYSRDFRSWLHEQAITVDEATQSLRAWPRDKAYLDDLAEALQTYRLIAVPKSRRMMVSWIMAAWCCWNARYHPNHAIFWQSDTEAHAAFVTDRRVAFLEDNLREPLLRRRYIAHRTKDGLVGKIEYETGSYIWAIPQGDAVIRSYTFSIMVMDESEFQPEAHRAFTAAVPIAEKGAQLILVSTSNGPSGVLAALCREVGMSRFT